jgi:hypothetical protein
MKKYLITTSLLFLSYFCLSQIKYDDGPLTTGNTFALSGTWNTNNLTYSFTNGTNDILNNDEYNAIREAFRIWADYGNLNFTEVANGGQIEISWQVGAHGDANPFDGVNLVLAHAFLPPTAGWTDALAGDIHFDDDENWTMAERPIFSGQSIDLVTVAAHEIGHALGLGHSNVSCALMNPLYNGSHRFLAQDDINGIRAIYGNRSPINISNLNCNGGNFSIRNFPTGSTLNWSTNNQNAVNLTSSGNTATVSRNGNNNGNYVITSTLSLACGIIITESTPVETIGVPIVTFDLNSYPYSEPSCYEIYGIYSFRAQQATGYPNTFDGFQWGWRNLTNNTSSNDPTIYGSDYTLIPEDQGTHEIWLRATNSCGTSTLESVKTIVVNNYCISGFRSSAINTISIYPNPAKNFINLTVTSNSKTEKKPSNNNIKLELYESITSKKVKEWKFLSNQNTFTLDIQGIRKGIYYLKFINGKDIKTQQVIIE